MRKLIFSLLIIVNIVFVNAQNNDSAAKDLLNSVSVKMKSYKTMYIDFINSLENKEEEINEKTKGNVSIDGDKYVVNMMGATIIFDGTKMFTIDNEEHEVTITSDEDDEDIFSPAKLFTFYETGFNYKMDQLKTEQGRKIQYVKLLPIDSESELDYCLIGVDVKTNHIKKIIQVGKNNTKTTVNVEVFIPNKSLNEKIFTFSKDKFKGYIINEL